MFASNSTSSNNRRVTFENSSTRDDTNHHPQQSQAVTSNTNTSNHQQMQSTSSSVRPLKKRPNNSSDLPTTTLTSVSPSARGAALSPPTATSSFHPTNDDEPLQREHQQQHLTNLFTHIAEHTTTPRAPPSQPFRSLDPNWVQQNPTYQKPKYFQAGLNPAGCLSDEMLQRHAHQLSGDMVAMDRALVVESLDAIAAPVDEFTDEVGPSFGLTQAVNVKRSDVLKHHQKQQQNKNNNYNIGKRDSFLSPPPAHQGEESTSSSRRNSSASYQSPFLRRHSNTATGGERDYEMTNNAENGVISNQLDMQYYSPHHTNEPPVYFLSIELEKGKVGSVALRPDSNCAEIARQFVERHELDEGRVVPPLTKYLQEELRNVMRSITGSSGNSGKNKEKESSGIRSYLQKQQATSSRGQPSFSRPLRRFQGQQESGMDTGEELILVDDDGDDLENGNVNNNNNNRGRRASISNKDEDQDVFGRSRVRPSTTSFNREARKAIAASQEAKKKSGTNATPLRRTASASASTSSTKKVLHQPRTGSAAFRAKGRDDDSSLKRKTADQGSSNNTSRTQTPNSRTTSGRSGFGSTSSKNDAKSQKPIVEPIFTEVVLKTNLTNNNNNQQAGGNRASSASASSKKQQGPPPRKLSYWEREINRADDLLKSGRGTNAAFEAERKKRQTVQQAKKKSQSTTNYLLMTGKSTQDSVAPVPAAVSRQQTENQKQQQQPKSVGDRLYDQAFQKSLKLAKLRMDAKKKEDQEVAAMSFKPEIHASPKNAVVHHQDPNDNHDGDHRKPSSLSRVMSSEERELKENCTFKPQVDKRSDSITKRDSTSGERSRSSSVLERMQKREEEAAERLEEKRKYLSSIDPETGKPYFAPQRH